MPLYDRNIGRENQILRQPKQKRFASMIELERTGVDVKAGKNIRILDNGFENFSDYWTDESETEDTYEQIFSQKENETAVKSAKQTKNKVKVRSMSPFSSVDNSRDSMGGRLGQSRVTAGTSECMSQAQSSCATGSVTETTKHAPEGGKVNELEGDLNGNVTTANAEKDAVDKTMDKEEVTVNNINTKCRDVSSGPMQKDGVESVSDDCDINTAGEVNGTITRGEQVLDFKQAKISSAVQSFKTRKRLTYSSGTSPETTQSEVQKQQSLQPKATTSEFKVPFPKSKKKSPRKSDAKSGNNTVKSNTADVDIAVTSDVSAVENVCAVSSPVRNITEDNRPESCDCPLDGQKGEEAVMEKGVLASLQQHDQIRGNSCERETERKQSHSKNTDRKKTNGQKRKTVSSMEVEGNVAEDHSPTDQNEVLVSDSEKDESEDHFTFATLSQKQPIKSSLNKRKSSVDLELKLLKKQEVETLKIVKTATVQGKGKRRNSRSKNKMSDPREEGQPDKTSPNKRDTQNSADNVVVGLPPLPTKPGRKNRKRESVTNDVETEHQQKSSSSDEQANSKSIEHEALESPVRGQQEVDNLHKIIEENVELPVRVTRSKGSRNKGGEKSDISEQACSTSQETTTKNLKTKASQKGKKGKGKKSKVDKQNVEIESSNFRIIGEVSLCFDKDEKEEEDKDDNDVGSETVESSRGNNKSSKTSRKSREARENCKQADVRIGRLQRKDKEASAVNTDKNIKDIEDRDHTVDEKENAESDNVVTKATEKTSAENKEPDIFGENEHSDILGENKRPEVLDGNKQTEVSDENKQTDILGENRQSDVSHENRDTEIEENPPVFENASLMLGGDLNAVESEDDFEVVEQRMSIGRLSVGEHKRRRSKSSSKSASSQEDEPDVAKKRDVSSDHNKLTSDDNIGVNIKLVGKKSLSTGNKAMKKTKTPKKLKQKIVSTRKSAVVVHEKASRSSRKSGSDHVTEQVIVTLKKQTEKVGQVKKGKKGTKGKGVKGSYVDPQTYRDRSVSTQSDSEGGGTRREKTKKTTTRGKQKVLSDVNTATDSDVESAKIPKLKPRQKAGNRPDKNSDHPALDNLSQVLQQLDFEKPSKETEKIKTNVINSTRVNTPGDNFENDEDLSRLMPSPNLSPIKRILTKPGRARSDRNLVNLTRSQCPVTPTIITKRRKRKHTGDGESSQGGTDNNSSGSVLNNPGASYMSSPPADKPMSPGTGEQPDQDEDSPVEADDEMVSPPEQKRAKKMTPVRHKGKKKTRTSSASGENTTPPKQSKVKGRKVQLSTTPLPPTPSTTPGKHIKSILKNSRFQTRTGTQHLGPSEGGNSEIVSTPLRGTGKRKFLSGIENGNSPMHIYEVTESQTPHPVRVTPPVRKQVKIIVPEAAPGSGLRRSQRTRVPCLDWFRNERIEYERRKSGGFVIKSVIIPEDQGTTTTVEPSESKPKRKGLQQKRSKKGPPATPSNLSLHTDPPDDFEEVENMEVPVLDPETGNDVLIECVKTKDDYEFVTPEGKDPTESDPLILAKIMKQRAFSSGLLILRPFEEKETQFVRKDTILFIVKYGKLAVTIHQTTVILETDATFFVPQGNTYSIKNLRCEEAKLWFFRHIGDKAVTPSSSQKPSTQSRK